MNDKLTKVIDELHINEKKVLKGLESLGYEAIPEEIVETQKMDIKAVMSAAGILESRGLIKVQKDVKNLVSLTDDGKTYAQKGLPERKLLISLGHNKSIPMKDISKKSGLNSSEVKIAIGWLVRKKWAVINRGVVEITPEGFESLNTDSDDEEVLKKLFDAQKILMDPTKMIKDSFNMGFNLLKQRKGIINVKKDYQYLLIVTDEGKAALDLGIDSHIYSNSTHT